MAETIGCDAVIRRIEESGPADQQLPPEVHDHLAQCPACADHLAEVVCRLSDGAGGTDVLAASDAALGRELASMATDLLASPPALAGGLGDWLVGRRSGGAIRPGWWLGAGIIAAWLVVVGACSLLLRQPPPKTVPMPLAEFGDSLEIGVRGLVRYPEGATVLVEMGKTMSSRTSPPAGLQELCRKSRSWFLRYNSARPWSSPSERAAREIVAGALKALHTRLAAKGGRPEEWLALWTFASIGSLRQSLPTSVRARIWLDATAHLPDEPVGRLLVLAGGLAAGLGSEAEQESACARAFDSRWTLYRSHGRFWDEPPWFFGATLNAGYCNRLGCSWELPDPRIPAIVEPAGFGGVYLRHWIATRGLAQLPQAFLAREWWPALVAWILVHAVPAALALGAGVALWLALMTFGARRTMSEALAVSPARCRGVLLWLGSGCLIVSTALFGLVDGVAWWAVGPGRNAEGRWDRFLEMLSALAGPGGSPPPTTEALLAFVPMCAAALVLVAVNLRVLTWAGGPAYRPSVRAALFPAGAVALLALGGVERPLSIEGPLVVATLVACLIWMLRRAPDGRDKTSPSLILGGTLAVLLANVWALISTSWPGLRAPGSLEPGSSAALVWNTAPDRVGLSASALLLALVLIPAWTGYLLVHLPPGLLRAQRLPVALVLAIGPLGYGLMLARACLTLWVAAPAAAPVASSIWQHPGWFDAVGSIVGLLVTLPLPWLAMRQGALLAPDGGGAFGSPVAGWLTWLSRPTLRLCGSTGLLILFVAAWVVACVGLARYLLGW